MAVKMQKPLRRYSNPLRGFIGAFSESPQHGSPRRKKRITDLSDANILV
jgi:hypothetical protein